MGMASITETLKALASSATIRSARGITCLILDEPSVIGLHTYARLKNVTDSFSVGNKKIITRCFSDRGVKSLKVVCYNSTAIPAETIDIALELLNEVKFNYLADPYASSADNLKIAAFIKAQREASNILVKSVLNNQVSDYEGVVNFINNKINIGEIVYTGTEFTVDIACLASMCALDSSLTNLAIDGVTDADNVGTDKDALVDAGKIFLFYDNDLEAIVLSRAVNSKTTIETDEKDSLKKIRVVDIIDMIRDDMKITFKSEYQGKVDNSLANKKLLVSAYNTYLRALAKAGALSDTKTSFVELDVNATIVYLEDEKKMDCSNMTDAQILAELTDEKVFITGTVYVLDVAEDLDLVLNY
jgi:hypothetical protein